MKKNLLALLLVFSALSLYSQDFTFTEIELPDNQIYGSYQATYNDLAYVALTDNIFFESTLYTFDGDQFTEIPNPDGFTLGYFLNEHEGILYFSYFDEVFNSHLFKLDGTTLIQIDIDVSNQYVTNFAFVLDDDLYFNYIDFLTFNNTLKKLEGNSVVDVDLPANVTYGESLGNLDGLAYLTLNDINFNNLMYAFDGTTFTQVNTPAGFPFYFNLTATEDALYIGFYDAGFNLSLFIFDGTDFTQVPSPPNNVQLQGFEGELDGFLYFSFFDNVTFFNALYRLDGTSWTEITIPPGYLYNYTPSVTESAFYSNLAQDLTFVNTLGVFNGIDYTLIPTPVNLNYNNFVSEYDIGFLVSYFDQNFNFDLQFYDGIDLMTVPPPEPGFNFQTLGFELDDLLYLVYIDLNFNQRLYRLGEPNVAPTAADNSVTTLKEMPYMFLEEDFNFADLNMNDTLAAIQVVSLPDSGYVHLNGGNVPPGYIIYGDDIELLTYIPSNGGLGWPYTSFQFKVSDGEVFSDEVYTMYINVTTSLSTQENLLAQNLLVYPNPTDGPFTLSLTDYNQTEDLTVRIFNPVGQLIQMRSISNSETTFDLSHLPKGLYFVEVHNGNSRAVERLLVK
ncbi:MAG: T9SS type A sorting domain-containing protein [Bacteroidetes bacterium]|nr:T9SS type A sorting domain-containing protein [Bacteroidota bacterium]